MFNKSNTMNLLVLPGPAVKESGKMISELEALGYEPFLVMFLEAHTHRDEHEHVETDADMVQVIPMKLGCIVARENHALEYYFF